MTDKLFFELWRDALAQSNKELYIGEYGYPDWFDEISTNPNEVVSILENIHDIAHMSVRDIISESGLTQAGFAVKFCIPLRTVEDWATGKRKCADYIRLMFARSLKLLNLDNVKEGNTENLKRNFLENIQKEIENIERRREELEKEARESWEEGLSSDSMDLMLDAAEMEERQQLRYLWNLCIQRGCEEEDLAPLFPEEII